MMVNENCTFTHRLDHWVWLRFTGLYSKISRLKEMRMRTKALCTLRPAGIPCNSGLSLLASNAFTLHAQWFPHSIKTSSPVLGSNSYTLGQQPEFGVVFGKKVLFRALVHSSSASRTIVTRMLLINYSTTGCGWNGNLVINNTSPSSLLLELNPTQLDKSSARQLSYHWCQVTMFLRC